MGVNLSGGGMMAKELLYQSMTALKYKDIL
jgi:hypothetical protein